MAASGQRADPISTAPTTFPTASPGALAPPASGPVPVRRVGFWAEFRARYFRTKTVAELQIDAEGTALKKSLGAVDLTALGVGALIGAGIFVFTGEAMQHAGPSVAVSLLIAAGASALAALAYAELAAMIPLGGSAYTYAYASMGELVAWIIAWNLVLEYAVGNMAVASGFSGNFQDIMTSVGITLPPALSNPPPVGLFDVPAFAASVLITILLLVGVKESARANLYFVIFKSAALALFIVVMVPHFSTTNLSPFAPNGTVGIMAGAAIIFFAFIGFDAVSTAAEETRNPQRDLPIGILASLAITTVAYVLVALALAGAVPYAQLNVADPLPRALQLVGESRMAIIMSIAGIVATTSVLLVFQLGATRIAYTLSRDGLIPAWFSRVHPKWRTPHISTIALGLFVGLFAALLPVQILVDLTNIGTLAAFIIVCLGVIVLRRTQPNARRAFRCPGVPWVPLAGALACFALVVSLPMLTIFRFVAWTGLGLIIYGAYGARRSKLGERIAAARDRNVTKDVEPGFDVAGSDPGATGAPGVHGARSSAEPDA
ncbi:MAG: amino acid permease [Thermoplasmatota archaeon]